MRKWQASEHILHTQLRLVFENGISDKGKVIYKNKNYNNINPTATIDELYSVADAISGLQSLQLSDIERNVSFMLAAE